MPPGPFPLPLIGNFHMMMGKDLHVILTELADKYGDQYRLSLGTEAMVIINDIETTRKTLSENNFSGRPESHFLDVMTRGYVDIVASDYSEKWKEIRTLALTSLRMLNDKDGFTENKLISESEALHRRISEKEGKIVSMKKELSTVICHLMCNVILGKDYQLDDKEFKEFENMTNEISTVALETDPIAYWGWIRFVYHTENYKKLLRGFERKDVFIAKQLKDRYLPQDGGKKQCNFTYYLLETSGKRTNLDTETKNQFEILIGDMVLAGNDTVLVALQWMIVYLLHWPHLQNIIYDEIIEKIGKERYPCLKDKHQLHHLQAFIYESLRYSSFVPYLVPHKTLEDAALGPYKVPRKTVIMYNVWKIHHDENSWKEANNFDISRWLTEEKEFCMHQCYLPFGLGKRKCIGDILAKQEVFIFVARLIKDFRIKPNENERIPDLDGFLFNSVIQPKPFGVFFEKRGN